MLITVHMSTPQEDRSAIDALDRWAELACIPVEVRALGPGEEPDGDTQVLLWDLDPGTEPPQPFTCGDRSGKLLLLCASTSGKAIDSYAMHPAGFLKKPMQLGALRQVLDRLVSDWRDEMDRLDILCGGLKRRIPLYDLLWVESSQHGTLLHTRREHIQTRESLRDLYSRLPEGVFLRCQRSFLVNLYHVRSLSSEYLTLDDGSEVPVGRRIREDVQEAYRGLCLTWAIGIPQTAEALV